MHLRTPKRYRSGYRRRGCIVSMRWLWLWILTPIVVGVGLLVYQNQDSIAPNVENAISGVLDDARSGVATMGAPEPTATPDPTDTIARADDAWRRGAIQEALGLYEDILANAPNNVAVHYHYAMGLVIQGQEVAALDAAENAVTANPFAADAWTVRAMAFNANGRYGEAIASALQALEIASEDAIEANPALEVSRARALAHLAEAYVGQARSTNGAYERAANTVQRALDLNPDNAHAYYVEGLLSQSRDFDNFAAREAFITAYELAPNMHNYGVEVAKAHYNLGDYDSLTATLDTILETNPNNTLALYWMGDYQFRQVGNYTQAAEYLNRCVDAEPGHILCNYMLGRSLERQELYTDALRHFEAALELAPTDDFNLGYYYFWVGFTHLQLQEQSVACSNLQQSYRIAVERGDELLMDSAAGVAVECGLNLAGASPTATPTPEDDGA